MHKDSIVMGKTTNRQGKATKKAKQLELLCLQEVVLFF